MLVVALSMASARGVGLQTLHSHVPAVVKLLVPDAQLSSTDRLNLAIALPLRNTATLSNLLQQIYDPASVNYHHYLTPEQFAEQFGPTDFDYQAVAAFAVSNHLQITTVHPNRLLLDVSGSAPDVERALHVTLHTYRHPTENRTFFAPDTEPSLNLSVPILHISGLDNYSLPRPHLVSKPLLSGNNAVPNAGSGPSGTFMGKDFRSAYVPNTSLNGTGQSVGLLQFDGYAASDITYYENKAGLPNVPLQNVLIDGATGNPSFNGGEVEVSLDIEMVISMATNLTKIIVYEAPNGSPFVDLLNRMATDNLAQQLSCSWFIRNGAAEPAADIIFQQMAAQGQSFFNASGDNDAYTGLISFPGDSPYITQVGGTTLTTSGPGGSWISETVWNWGGGAGSGGGISTQYPIPAWQTNISMVANQGSTTQRNIPDVAMTSDNIYVRADGSDNNEGGTSCAAPLWAGFAALVNQQAASSGQPAIGFVNPALTAIGTGSSYTTFFHDINTGNNESPSSPAKYSAVTGFDLCTGWGTPNGQGLINALANPEPLRITPATGFNAVGGVGGPFTVTSQIYSLTNGGTNTLTWTLSNTSAWLNASSSSGTLTLGGAAASLTIGLNNTASNLVGGAYTASIWFTNQNNHVGQVRQFTLTIINPPAITQQPSNQLVVEGTTARFSAQATGGLPLSFQWRQNGTNLIDGGNISGSTTTNLVISNAALANIGTYTLIATNVAGLTISSNAVLSLQSSGPLITLQPVSQTNVLGTTVHFLVAVVGTTPLSFQWSFNGTNISGATNTTLTIASVQPTNAGNYAVLVTNLYGATNSATAVLTVNLLPPCDPVPSGIVAWWSAESNALDNIAGNNGTLMNGTRFTNGEVGSAFNLNGVNQYVLANPANVANLDVGAGGGLTFEGWIMPNTVQAEEVLFEYARVLGTANGSDTGVGLAIHSNPPGGILYANLVDTSGVGHIFTSPSVITNLLAAGVWQHIAITYDKATAMAAFYINGVQVTPTNLGSFTPQTTYTNFTLGARTTFGSTTSPKAPFSGLMDEVSLYNRALSSNEITAVFLAGNLGKCFTPTPPLITIQPTNQTVGAGSIAMLTVAATGTGPLKYQWNFNGTNIFKATNATLTLNNVQPTNAGVYVVTVTNLYGMASSSNAMLTVFTFPPVITTQPTNRTVISSGATTFTVVASGTSPLMYQWSFNGTNLVNTTNATLTLTNIQPANAGIYAVTVTNLYGSVTSTNAMLTVLTFPPTITTQPSGQTVYLGATAQFAVGISGTAPFNYQWSVNGTNLVQATNATLILTNVQLTNAGNYTVLVTNLYGATNSVPALLTVNQLPPCDPVPSGIVAWWAAENDPSDSIGGNNGTLMNGTTFTNGEVGSAFNLNGINQYILSNPAAVTNLDVGTGSGFTFEEWIKPTTIATEQVLFEYARVLGTANGSDTGMGLAIHSSPPGGVLYANLVDTSGGGHIITSPGNILAAGIWQHIAVTYDKATGMAAYYINGVQIMLVNLGSFTPQTTYTNFTLGARTTFGSVANPAAPYSGLMDEVSLYNRALSSNEINAVFLAGNLGKCFTPAPPLITIQPTNQTVGAGSTPTFTVAATGTGPLKYQWNFNGTNIFKATNATLTLNNVQPTNAGIYAVTVTNLYGFMISSNATLTVLTSPPTITTQPSNQTVLVGSLVTFMVTASGTPTLSYQWTFNSTNLIGATNATLSVTNAQLTNAGNYAVAISNLYGSTNSLTAALTVIVPPISFTISTNLATGSNPKVVVATDINGDGKVDAIAGNSTAPTLSVFTNTGSGGLSLASSPGGVNNVTSLAAADVNGDGKVDLMSANYYNNSVTVLTNNGSGKFSLSATLAVGSFPLWVTAADVNGDGKVDVIAANSGGASVTVYTNTGNGGFVVSGTFPCGRTPWAVIAVTNLFGNGRVDLITADSDDSTLSVLTNNGTGKFGIMTSYHVGSIPQSVAAADVNEDGKLDLICANSSDNTVEVLTNNGSGGFSNSGIYPVGAGPINIALADVNGDGWPDLACANYQGNTVTILTNNMSGGFGAATVISVGINPSGLAFADINGDGKPDLFCANRGANTITILINGSIFPLTVPFITTQPTNQIVAAGSDANFNVIASGAPSLTYQWQFNGTNLNGATNPALSLVNVQLANGGNYSVIVTNSFGSVTSSNATLTVQAPPVIINQPTNLTVNVGASASFVVTVTGSLPLNYQWMFNGASNAITGATNASLTLTNVQLASAGTYAVTVTNLFGTATSTNVTLTVIDVLDHFAWNPIPSPRFVNAPFPTTIQAMDSINQLFTNFNGTALLTTTNGVAVNPTISSAFIQGAWTGAITISSVTSNLVLRAIDGAGHTGLANPINVIKPPSLSMSRSGSFLLIFWPVDPAGFVLEKSSSLIPPQWAPVTDPPFLIGNQYLESTQINNTNVFYRLRFNLP